MKSGIDFWMPFYGNDSCFNWWFDYLRNYKNRSRHQKRQEVILMRQKSRKRRLRKRDSWTILQLKLRKARRAENKRIRQWFRENREAI